MNQVNRNEQSFGSVTASAMTTGPATTSMNPSLGSGLAGMVFRGDMAQGTALTGVEIAPTGDMPLPDQDFIIKTLDRIGLNFPLEEMGDGILPLDPDRFYVAFVNGGMLAGQSRDTLDTIGKFFKKGGMLFLTKKDEAKGYSLEDLRSMREGMTALIDMVEKKNKTASSAINRFDIIKGECSSV